MNDMCKRFEFSNRNVSFSNRGLMYGTFSFMTNKLLKDIKESNYFFCSKHVTSTFVATFGTTTDLPWLPHVPVNS